MLSVMLRQTLASCLLDLFDFLSGHKEYFSQPSLQLGVDSRWNSFQRHVGRSDEMRYSASGCGP